MTKAPVRPRARAGFATGLGEIPTIQPAAAPDNIREKKYVDLNFKVSPELAHEMKVTAAVNGLKLKGLLEQAFEAWKREKARKND
jgi:hypothetical protein